jgi:hypothetical protein
MPMIRKFDGDLLGAVFAIFALAMVIYFLANHPEFLQGFSRAIGD